MKKFKKALTCFLVASIMVAVPVDMQCATRNLAMSAKGYKEIPIVKKTGVYKLVCSFEENVISDSEAFHFTAPSAGKYIFKFSDMDDDGGEDSSSFEELHAAGSLTFGGWLNYNDDSSFGPKAPELKETVEDGISIASFYRGRLCIKEFPPKITMRYKLLRGEKVYFFAGGKSCSDREKQTVELKLTIKKQ